MTVRKGVLLVIVALGTILARGGAKGDNLSHQLAPEELERLTPEAKTLYDKGVEYLDHIDEDEALICFSKVAELEPLHVGAHFLVADLAANRGRKTLEEASLKHYEHARDTYQKILDLEGKVKIRRHQLQRAEKGLQTAKTAIAGHDERTEKLEKIGMEILKEHFAEMDARSDAFRKKLDDSGAERAEEAGARRGGGGRGGGGPGGYGGGGHGGR